ncbi:50S ribosomal protein L7/L12-serine acetyltransferase [Pseudescherichia sp.]|uniref:50S ribosomal protein L7/L12-serine acetyltransferase n=1 Tax=Pseudescherichia sp. TaxID=2055881 RepID=UPI002897275F|nr:50S ribosomal protein L7/L12-serine acetyltransferase [Pseudescherichia sp.]
MQTSTDELIPVSDTLRLCAIDERYVSELHQLVVKNRAWLQQSLNWPQYVASEEDSLKNAQSNIMLHQRGYAKMFLIMQHEAIVGVLSFNAIEPLNKTAYIGYWLDEGYQGQGILSQSLEAFIQHYARSGEIRRFVIKCRVENAASNRVAQRAGFVLEGCLKEAEFLNGRYDDQHLYARIIDA